MGFCSFVPMGRMGNALFQAAASYAYAKKHGFEFSVPHVTTHDFWSPLYLHRLQKPEYQDHAPRHIVREQAFHYNELPFEESWRNANIVLSGYFQSEKYFAEYRDEILEAFAFPWQLIPDVCAIHARYGDYLTIEGKHVVLSDGYLIKAMSLVSDKTGIKKFRVFSDDINEFKKRHGHLYNFEYPDSKGIESDLIEGSCCHSLIGSSSTFAWWMGWLNRNPDKVCVFGKQWFQPGWGESGIPYNTDDIYAPFMTKI